MDAADRRQRAEPRVPARQPRRRDPRRHRLRRHAGRLPRRARREARRRALGGQVGDNPTGHAITAAPLAVDGKIIVGISGGEAGIRGFLDAYDAKTGKQVWRFWTVPSPGEPGSESWPGDSWVHGGGATWLTGSYDPELKLLYWGTGNPGPDWNGDSRKGDNLYTSSLVAIDVDDRQGALAFPVHAARRARLGREPDSRCSSTPTIGGAAAEARRDGEPQRLLLRAGSQHRRVPARRAVREADVGEGTRCEGPADSDSEHGAVRERDAGLSEPAGLDELGQSVLQPGHRMLYVPVREMGSIYYKTGGRVPSRARTTPAAAKSGSTRNRGARCARSTSRPANRCGTSSCRRRPGRA